MNGHMLYMSKFSTDIDQFQTVAENQNLSKKDLRIFLFLCCRLTSKRYVKLDKKQIAESLCMTKKEIDKSIDNLINEGILSKGSDEHVKSGYKLTYTGYNKD